MTSMPQHAASALLPTHQPIVISGAGPVGLALALGLEQAGAQPMLLDRSWAVPPDPRWLALSAGGVALLQQWGLDWHTLDAAPIQQVHVSQQNGWGHTLLRAEDVGSSPLGWVVNYAVLRQALIHLAQARRIRMGTGQVQAWQALSGYVQLQLVDGQHGTCEHLLLAEGSAASSATTGPARHKDYAQQALLFDIDTDSTPSVAYERFAHAGPMACLPRPGGMVVIWSLKAAHAHAMLAEPPETNLWAIQQAMAERLPPLSRLVARHQLPLALRYRHPVLHERVFALGNAAQSLHPIAGQGLNLGLRDAWDWVRAWKQNQVQSGVPLAATYARLRRADQSQGVALTDGLLQLFAWPGLAAARGRDLGLLLLDRQPRLKQALLRRMMFGARV